MTEENRLMKFSYRESEAKQKWCHRSMSRPDTEFAHGWTKCEASDCMAWVQDRTAWCNPDGTVPTPAQMAKRTSGEAGLITVTYGHCGLIK